MFRTARYHCKFAQRWSEKTDIPDISLPHHRQDDLHPHEGGHFLSTSGEREPEHPGYSECHENIKTSPWNSIWKEIWSRQTIWEGYQPSRKFELWIDWILTQKRLSETRRDWVNFDFKFKSSVFSSALLSPNSRIRVGDSWRNCGILDKVMSCFFVFVFRDLNCELWISISPHM